MKGLGELALLILSIITSGFAVNSCPGPDTWSDSIFLLHEDCQKFYKCVFGEPIQMSCPPGLYFNIETSQCDWKANVNCPNDESEEQGSQFLENGCPRDHSVHWLLPHENDCNLFYTCVSGRKLKRNCPGSLHFDFKQQICGWPKPEGCNTPDEDSSSEIDSSENINSNEDNSIEGDTKEDISKEVDTIEDFSKEDSSSESSSENNSSEGDKTIEEFSEEDISKENDSNENKTEEDSSKEDISKENDTDENESKESVSNEDTSSEDSRDVTSEENTAEEDTSNDDKENHRIIKKIEAIVDVKVLKLMRNII